MKIRRPVGAQLLNAKERTNTDRHDEAILRRRPKNALTNIQPGRK